jgi:hypothetical protein
MTEENNPEKGELRILDYGGKILSIYRRCSCGGDVKIGKDEEGKNLAKCKVCGTWIKWNDGDTLEDIEKG